LFQRKIFLEKLFFKKNKLFETIFRHLARTKKITNNNKMIGNKILVMMAEIRHSLQDSCQLRRNLETVLGSCHFYRNPTALTKFPTSGRNSVRNA
jgi:hypothetical protein